MISWLMEALLRARKSPVAIIGLIGSILVVLANAAPAVDGAQDLWRRWTRQQAQLESTWQGNWKSRSGYTYVFAMQLGVQDDETAAGQIRWELVATPPNSHLADRIGDSATEYVSGRFDKSDNVATLDGYDVTDPTLIALDSYKFQIKNDKVSFVGMSKHHGEWEAEAQGSVIVTAK